MPGAYSVRGGRFFARRFGESEKNVYLCLLFGGLAQLARALAWHARGHEFESRILHWKYRVKRQTLRISDSQGFLCSPGPCTEGVRALRQAGTNGAVTRDAPVRLSFRGGGWGRSEPRFSGRLPEYSAAVLLSGGCPGDPVAPKAAGGRTMSGRYSAQPAYGRRAPCATGGRLPGRGARKPVRPRPDGASGADWRCRGAVCRGACLRIRFPRSRPSAAGRPRSGSCSRPSPLRPAAARPRRRPWRPPPSGSRPALRGSRGISWRPA